MYQILASFSSLWAAVMLCTCTLSIIIMKVYIERKNMQVKLIPFREKYRLYFKVGNFREHRVYEIGLISIHDVSPLLCRLESSVDNAL